MFSAQELSQFWPHADPAWRDAFAAHHREWGQRWGMTTARRWRHFMAQVSAETAGLVTSGKGGLPLPGMVENHRYSAQGILRVFAKRLRLAARDNPQYRGRTIAEIAAIWSHTPELLFEGTYGGRKELGNTEPGDGWRFRGRGPLQVTGREWYERVSREIGIDCVTRPELLEDPRYGWQAAFVEWSHAGCNDLADRDDVDAVSKRVNGGTNGLAERRAWLKRAEQFWPGDDTWKDLAARERATLGDLARVSRKASAVSFVKTAAASTAAVSATVQAAQESGVADAAAEAVKGGGLVGTISEWTTVVQITHGFGEAIGNAGQFVVGHAWLVVALAAGGLALGAVRLGQWMVEDYRDGRYDPRRASPPSVGGGTHVD